MYLSTADRKSQKETLQYKTSTKQCPWLTTNELSFFLKFYSEHTSFQIYPWNKWTKEGEGSKGKILYHNWFPPFKIPEDVK